MSLALRAAGALVAVTLLGCSARGNPSAASIATTTLASIPVAIQVDGTAHLTDGQGVKVRVTAKSGSQIFGFEARLCAGGESYQFDSDTRPTRSGKCTTSPVSANSDSYQEVRAVAPFEVADTTFRAGVGSNQFVMENGMPVTIVCGSAHPCELVLKVQFPNGFAIRAYPLSYG